MTETAHLPVAPAELVDVQTGERLPVTVENAARVLKAAREMKRRIDEVIRDATAYLAQESTRLGTKTIHAEGATVTLKGGTSVEYDPQKLMELLRETGCPEERISAAVVETVTYKVNRAVLKQLAAANPDYGAAIELSSETVETGISASVS